MAASWALEASLTARWLLLGVESSPEAGAAPRGGLGGELWPSQSGHFGHADVAASAAQAGLGDDFVASYLKLRRQHWAEYTAQLTPWELATYLDA